MLYCKSQWLNSEKNALKTLNISFLCWTFNIPLINSSVYWLKTIHTCKMYMFLRTFSLFTNNSIGTRRSLFYKVHYFGMFINFYITLGKSKFLNKRTYCFVHVFLTFLILDFTLLNCQIHVCKGVCFIKEKVLKKLNAI